MEPTDRVIVEDEPSAEVTTTGELPRRKYRITDKTAREELTRQVTNQSGEEKTLMISRGSEGVFKNGVLYKPGDVVELDAQTAQNFLANGEIEEMEQE